MPYFFFQLKYVARLIPALRQTSATGVPSFPCLMTNAFRASVNFDAFMPRLLAQPRKSEAESSSSKRSGFQVAEQSNRNARPHQLSILSPELLSWVTGLWDGSAWQALPSWECCQGSDYRHVEHRQIAIGVCFVGPFARCQDRVWCAT